MELITPGSEEYKKRVKGELAHYNEVFKEGRLFQDVPESWARVEQHVSDAIEAACGVRSLPDYIARFAKGKSKISLLTLGAGSCGMELDIIAPLLKKQGTQLELTCADINEEILQQAQAAAKERNVGFTPMVVDANTMTLKKDHYDVIMAYAALHHFLDLDHSVFQINRALKSDGIFTTVDIPTKNGYMMWDETYTVVNNLFLTLPERYRIDHTGYAEPTLIDVYENTNHAVSSFECVNSEAVLPALRDYLEENVYAPTLTIARRFFDTKFGPNYDFNRPLDNAIFNYILQLDDYYLENGILQPETFFGVYIKTANKKGPKKASAKRSLPVATHRSMQDYAKHAKVRLHKIAKNLKRLH